VNAKEKMRRISIETSMPVIRNITAADHSGLVTLELERGVIRRIWCGTKDGLLMWKDGKTIHHVIANVERPLIHGGGK